MNYIAAAEAFADKTEIVSDLPPTLVYTLASRATPADVREEVVRRREAGETVPVAEINDLVRDGRARAKKTAAEAKLSPKDKAKRERRQRELAKERAASEARQAEEIEAAAAVAAELLALAVRDALNAAHTRKALGLDGGAS